MDTRNRVKTNDIHEGTYVRICHYVSTSGIVFDSYNGRTKRRLRRQHVTASLHRDRRSSCVENLFYGTHPKSLTCVSSTDKPCSDARNEVKHLAATLGHSLVARILFSLLFQPLPQLLAYPWVVRDLLAPADTRPRDQEL